MSNCGAHPHQSESLKTTTYFFDLHWFGFTVKCEDPLAGEFFALFRGILVEIHYVINAGCNYPIDQPHECGSAGGVERALYTRSCVFLEAEVFASTVLLGEIQVRVKKCDVRTQA